MRINRAIGLGLVILIFQWLTTGLWYAFETTVIAVFDTTQTALSAAEVGMQDFNGLVIPAPVIFPE